MKDGLWEGLAPFVARQVVRSRVAAKDNHLFLEGALWIARTGSPWRGLPETTRTRCDDASDDG